MDTKKNIKENKRFVIFTIIIVSILASLLGLAVFAETTESQSGTTKLGQTEGVSDPEESIIEEKSEIVEKTTEGVSARVLATNIEVDKSKVLIFGSDNKYIIKDHSSEAIPVVTEEEWAVAADTYNENTVVSILPNADEYDMIGSDMTKLAYIHTVAPAKIEMIKTVSDFTNLLILENSDITINTNGADGEGINVNNLKILQNSKINVTAKDTAVKINVRGNILEGSTFTAKTTSATEVPKTATVFVGENLDIIGSTVNIESSGGPYGLRVGLYPEDMPWEMGYSNFQNSTITVTTKTGRAISCGANLNITASNVSGIATEGSIGIHTPYLYLTMDEVGTNPIVFGKAQKGFGVVAQSIDSSDTEFPYGSLSVNGGSLIGEVDEGMGISVNMASISDSDVTGTAEKGIGVSLCMLSSGSNIIVKGISHGETTEHFQVYDAIPDSCGISSLSNFHVGENSEVIGLAPKELNGSIGISAYLPDAYGNVNGGMNINTLGKLEAVGDIGIRAVNFSSYSSFPGEAATVDIDARSLGMKAASFVANNTQFNINASDDDSTGLLLETYGQANPSYVDFNITNTPLNVTAGKVGIDIKSEKQYAASFTIYDSVINTKAITDAGFSVKLDGEILPGYPLSMINITGSNLTAESDKEGFIFDGVALSINTTTDSEDPNIIGIGGETGIHFLNLQENPAINLSASIIEAGKFYTIKGVSKSTAPDKLSRKPALILGDLGDGAVTLGEKARVIEEYKVKAPKIIVANEKYMIYADGMNAVGMDGGVWNDPNNWRHSEPRYDLDLAAGQGISSVAAARNTLIVGNMAPGLITFDPAKSYYEIILTADINLMDITFDTDGGTPVPSSQKALTGELLAVPTDPTKVGHRFLSWTYPNIDTIWDFNNPVGGSPMNLVAKWERIAYVATFDATGGEPKIQQTASNYNESIIPPEIEPTRRLFKFLGWYKDKELTIPFDFLAETMPENDITIYAKWERTHYEVFFNGNGANVSAVPETMAIEIGKPVDILIFQPGAKNAPKYKEHFFLGWKNQDGQAVIANFNMPTNDVTLTANWVNAKNIISFSPGNSIVSYKNEITKEEVSKEINSKAEYTDYMGVTHIIDVYDEWNTNAISNGGVEKVNVYIVDSEGNRIYSDIHPYVYIINRPIIYGADTALFQQFEPVPNGGVSWPVFAFQELPDFKTKTINRIPLDIKFVENGFTTQVFGNHYPYFTATGVDYFGNKFEKEHHVSAIVIAQDLQAELEHQHLKEESAFWIEVAEALHLSKEKEHLEIDGNSYKEGPSKKENLTTTDLFDRIVVAEPFTFLRMSSEPLQILKEQKNSRLVVKQGFINWYFDSEDFKNQKYDPTGFYDLKVNSNSSDALKSIGKNGNSMELHFALDKYWQGKATLNVKVNQKLLSSAEQGNKLYLFYYNEAIKELEIIDIMHAETDGFFSVKLSGVFKDYIILDHLPGGYPISEGAGPNSSGSGSSSTSGSSSSNDSKVYGISYRITDKTNPLSDELRDDIEKNLELIGKTIDQITFITLGTLGEDENEKSNLPAIIGTSAVGITGASALVLFYLKKRKNKEDIKGEEDYDEFLE